jgi:hypothetical protein
MLTLKELLKLNETVTLLALWVRRPDGSLIIRSIIGQPYNLTGHQLDDIEKGKLQYLDVNINKYGRTGRSGMTEIAFGMDWKAIPKKYLDAEVTDIGWLHERYGNVRGSILDCTIVPIQLELDCAWK